MATWNTTLRHPVRGRGTQKRSGSHGQYKHHQYHGCNKHDGTLSVMVILLYCMLHRGSGHVPRQTLPGAVLACVATAPQSPFVLGSDVPCCFRMTVKPLPATLLKARKAVPNAFSLHSQAGSQAARVPPHPSPNPQHPPVMPRAMAVAVLAASVSWGEARPSGCSTMQVCAQCAATMSRCLGKEGLPKRVWISSWVLRRRLATSCTSSTGHGGHNRQRQVSPL